MRSPSSLLKTPPYVTATPVVTHFKMSLPTPTAKLSQSMRFVVLATDGLWDELTSHEVVALVGGFLAGTRGNISSDSLSKIVPVSDGSLGVDGKEKRKQRRDDTWTFVDDNVSTHLIRNAFGGGNETKLRQMISIPAPYSRRYRDDITVTVIWWEDGEQNAVKAKL
jgi:pyruvate dehydrogenase phosphatase